MPTSPDQRLYILSELRDHYFSWWRGRLASAQVENATIREVYDQHINARELDSTIHPWLLIIINQPDWIKDGVLLVNLSVPTDQGDAAIGVTRCDINGETKAPKATASISTLAIVPGWM